MVGWGHALTCWSRSLSFLFSFPCPEVVSPAVLVSLLAVPVILLAGRWTNAWGMEIEMGFFQKIAVMAAIVTMMGAGSAMAGWKPDGPLTLQIGFGAGGSTDTMGRVLARVMKDQTGWNIFAETKTGGGGVAMFTGIAKAPGWQGDRAWREHADSCQSGAARR